jgi:two-component system nitrate/nitrite response regulator NarL
VELNREPVSIALLVRLAARGDLRAVDSVLVLNAVPVLVAADVVDGGGLEMKILICDQQLMLAEALAAGLDGRGYDVLAVTTTVSDTCNAVGHYVPDVCLLGLHAGQQLDGPDTVRAILRRYPGTKVLVLSEVTAPETLSQLIRSGVAGVTHLGQSVAQIAETLDATEAGRDVLNPGPLRVPAQDTSRLAELSPRETEILARIASGQSTRQMSCTMNITVDTVRTYVKNVLTKLGAHSRLELAALASREGLLIDRAMAADALSRGTSGHLDPSQIAAGGEGLTTGAIM